MEPHWLIIILGLIALIALRVIFIIQNQKVKKEFIRKLYSDNELSHDNEVNHAE